MSWTNVVALAVVATAFVGIAWAYAWDSVNEEREYTKRQLRYRVRKDEDEENGL